MVEGRCIAGAQCFPKRTLGSWPHGLPAHAPHVHTQSMKDKHECLDPAARRGAPDK